MDLTFDGVVVTLGGRTVLRDIGVTLRPGRLTAILGPNGAGKTTLLKAAAALLTPERGQVAVGGHDVQRLRPRERARLIGYLPQDVGVHWNVAAKIIVALGRMPYRSPFAAPSAADLAAVAAAMAATETVGLADRPVAALSGGERARVLLARVLAGEPRWLLADEPLASLDAAHQIDLLAHLRRVADGGAGVAIVLHDLVQAQRVADDALLIAADGTATFGPVADLLSPDAIARAFGVRVVAAMDRGRRLYVPIART